MFLVGVVSPFMGFSFCGKVKFCKGMVNLKIVSVKQKKIK